MSLIKPKQTTKQKRRLPAKPEQTCHFPLANITIPARFEDIVTDVDPLRPDGAHLEICAYLALGWNVGGDRDTHMIELSNPKRDVIEADLVATLETIRRCYCSRCLDPDMHDGKKKTLELLMSLELRATVAEANKIPLDGTPEHEAQIDKLLTLETPDAS
ncbi:MAG: hypothetical protein WAV09_03205 [Minisyncoccia bacterium]